MFVTQTIRGKCNMKMNAPNYTKLYIQLHPHFNCSLETFSGNQSTSGAVDTIFSEFSGYLNLSFKCMEKQFYVQDA